MSHLTGVDTKLRELDVLKQAIDEMGCQFNEETTYQSAYVRSIDCVGTISAKGKQVSNYHGAAVTQDESGYQIKLDNYRNTLTDVAGEDCVKITQKYGELIATDEMINSGFSCENSWVDTKTGDRVLEFVG